MSKHRIIAAMMMLWIVVLGGGSVLHGLGAQAQEVSRYFPQTAHLIKGKFLTYWEQHGGLVQQGYPISEEMQEKSDTNGKTYTVQYFERAVFEYHPELLPSNDVLLSLLGVFEYKSRYAGGADGQTPNGDPRSVLFQETGKRLGGSFLQYWQSHGGLAQQGFPISDEFKEKSVLDGKVYTVQYFERAVFEWHPENKGTAYEVLLSQLGTFRYSETRGVLTIPQGQNRNLSNPQGSDDYLVWEEKATTPIKGPIPTGTSDIIGISLKTGKSFPVVNSPGDQFSPAISGSTVVWLDQGPSCPGTCRYDIMGKDLRAGESFSVATGPVIRNAPVVSGHKVAWGERDQTGDHVILKNLETGETQVIASAPQQEMASVLYVPQLSEEYIVWLNLTLSAPDPNTHVSFYTYTVRAYDMRTREIRSIFSETMKVPGIVPRLSISGHKLVWDAVELRFADLETGETTVLPTGSTYVSDPLIRGDRVFWITNYGLLQTMKLSERVPVTLVRDVSPGSRPTIAGDWLVWQTSIGRLQVAKLSALLANPPTALPTPVPTQQGLIPTTIPTPGPDLTATYGPVPTRVGLIPTPIATPGR